MKGVILFLFVLLGGYMEVAATPVLLPQPQEVKWTARKFPLDAVELKEVQLCREELLEWLKEVQCEVRTGASRKVEVVAVDSLPGVRLNAEEAYRLHVDGERIRIEAVTDRGAYWALQTLRQMVEQSGKKKYLPGCEMTDWPAFRIRGFMHDVGRGYLSVEELKHQIAKLSRYKINVFHWHLTEDLAWRLESRVFPMLNDSVNFGRYPGKYYTLEEAKELVAFCKAHRVMLIPEVDMPGHSAAFRKTFRHDMQSKEGMAILKLLMDEVCETFEDVPYLHIGTDEVQFTNPRFVPEMVAYMREKGKKVISWNPGWKYQPGEIDMLQMWSYRGKPHKGIPVIDCRLHYLNHFDAFADLVGLFKSTIGGVQEGSPDFAGVVLAVWNDRKVEPERNIMLENGFYPAMLTIAERSWQGGGNGYFYELGTL
ncbi:MAG: beta-N-acetylhexosaminidase, partial [Odoribacter sp.]|nr:beta-N-acetylhexosaminidase [Odoribacter sp.]